MRHWLSIDGGGSKITVVLFDETLRIIGSSKAGGINSNFQSEESIRRNIQNCLNDATRNFVGDIVGAYVSMPTSRDILSAELLKLFPRAEIFVFDEGEMGIRAGLCEEFGFLVLSGTGSDVYYKGENQNGFIGGMGILLGDEGSGAYIGQKALMAVVYSVDGRGVPTLMEKAFSEFFGFTLSKSTLVDLCEKLYTSPAPRAVLASFAPYVFRAAAQKDSAALDILEDATSRLALQTTVLARQMFEQNPAAYKIGAVCGGVWKSSRSFYESFCQKVNKVCPELEIHYPLFEPVVGGAVAVGYCLGYNRQQLQEILTKNFDEFSISLPKIN